MEIMEIMEIMRARHSVRQYLELPIAGDVRAELDGFVGEVNRESGMRIQILYDEPGCFDGRMARYGKFENARNYIALVGPKGADLDEKAGYYGEKIVLKAQELGLNTCWVALTRGKSRATVGPGEKEAIVISLGYGKTQGAPRRGKDAGQVSNLSTQDPEWFRRGVEAALLAPTAINQQKFKLLRDGNFVTAKTQGIGSCLKIDLGIVKCHFEMGAGKENFAWR